MPALLKENSYGGMISFAGTNVYHGPHPLEPIMPGASIIRDSASLGMASCHYRPNGDRLRGLTSRGMNFNRIVQGQLARHPSAISQPKQAHLSCTCVMCRGVKYLPVAPRIERIVFRANKALIRYTFPR